MNTKTTTYILCSTCVLVLLLETVFAQPYSGGIYDFGEGRYGERRGDLSPAGIAGIVIGSVAIAAALIVTGYFCYYAYSTSGPDQQYQQQQNLRYQQQQNHHYQQQQQQQQIQHEKTKYHLANNSP